MPALSAMAEGVEINLDDAQQAEASAKRLQDAIYDPAIPNSVSVAVEANEEQDSWRLILSRMHHGNVRISIFDRTFVRGADYTVMAKTAQRSEEHTSELQSPMRITHAVFGSKKKHKKQKRK